MVRKAQCTAVVASLLMLTACGDSASNNGGTTNNNVQDCTGEPDQVVDQGVINTDTTLQGCVRVEQYVGVTEGANVTIAPGSTLEFADAAGFKILSSGSLNAVGTAEEPILMTGGQAVAGHWNGLYFEGTTNQNNALAHVVIEHAGNDIPGSISLDSETVRISIDNTIIRQGKTAGVWNNTYSKANITSFENNTISGHAVPISTRADGLTAITSSNTLTDNTNDWVEVTEWLLESDTTIHNAGVPLLITEGIGLPANAPVRLTIEPGVELIMGQNTDITAQEGSVINAEGTAEEPIMIRGKEELAGYWRKIRFEESRSNDNILEHIVISDAGAEENIALDVGGVSSGSLVTINNAHFERIDGVAIHVNDYSELAGCGEITFSEVSGDNYNRQDACP